MASPQCRAGAARDDRRGQGFTPSFAGELFGPGKMLDAATHYIILPDGIGTEVVEAFRWPPREVTMVTKTWSRPSIDL
jgi:hypothetical protein